MSKKKLQAVPSSENVTPINKNCVGGKKKKVVHQNTLQSFNKIAFCENFDPGYLCQIKAVVKEVWDACQVAEDSLQKGYVELAKKDKNGDPIILVEKTPQGEIRKYDFSPLNKKKADELYQQSQESLIMLSHRPKLNLSKLSAAKLSPVDLMNLDWMIDEES